MTTLHTIDAYLHDWRADLDARLRRIELAVKRLTEAGLSREHYTVAEFAKVVGRAEYTVREWARLGRLRADKTHGGRGDRAEWRFPHAELLRFQAEGLLPDGRTATAAAEPPPARERGLPAGGDDPPGGTGPHPAG